MNPRKSIAVLALGLLPFAAQAMPHVWTEWTGASVGSSGSATGTMNIPGIGLVTVSYTGEVASPTQVNDTGVFYWTNPATYTSALVPNPPTRRDIISLVGGPNVMTSTLTFSQPVGNLAMSVLSLGGWTMARYVFDRPFTLASQGPGYFGSGPLSQPAANILEGREGHGTILFPGTITSLSWTMPASEFWHGFTVGAVPEPASLAALALGLVALRRFRKR
jgi:hypothetical protein